MATQYSKPGARLHPTKKLNPAIAEANTPSNDEAPWQQLMIIDYLMFEAIDTMDQERATGGDCPLNLHWQQFVHLLRIKKPKLGAYLDRLRDQLQETQGGVQ